MAQGHCFVAFPVLCYLSMLFRVISARKSLVIIKTILSVSSSVDMQMLFFDYHHLLGLSHNFLFECVSVAEQTSLSIIWSHARRHVYSWRDVGLNEQAQGILIRMALSYNEGSGEPARIRRLARAFVARTHIV